MLNRWLSCAERNPGYDDFTVVDASCNGSPDDADKEHLRTLLTSARVDPDFLRAAADELGWEQVGRLIDDYFPQRLRTKRGFFGEVLAVAVLEEFEGYTFPVQKLRYSIQGDQTLPGTDAIAIRTGMDNEIEELCFVESKFRSQTDYGAAVQAYEQLKADTDKRVPDMLRFVAERLHERGDPQSGAVMRYMSDRSGRDERDSFRICLTWESASWSDRVLDDLQDNEVELDPLGVHVIPVTDLVSLTDELLKSIGIENIDEDDD